MARLAGLGALLAVLATFVTGCGVGTGGDEGKVSDSADAYLRSLAAGDAASPPRRNPSGARASSW